MRTNLDLTPYRRSTVGFDRLFDLLESSMPAQLNENYPPFDLVREGDDRYRITLAVAGFRADGGGDRAGLDLQAEQVDVEGYGIRCRAVGTIPPPRSPISPASLCPASTVERPRSFLIRPDRGPRVTTSRGH